MKNEQLINWYTATDLLAEYFVSRYFGKDATDVFWVADEVGGVLAVNDCFFSLTDMVEFIRYRYSRKDMHEYYEYALELAMKENHPMKKAVWRGVHKTRIAPTK